MESWEKKSVERKKTAHEPKQTTSSVKHGGGSVMSGACVAASVTGSLVFTDDVTTAKTKTALYNADG